MVILAGWLFLMSEVSLQVKDANVIIGDVHFDSHHYLLLQNCFVFAAWSAVCTRSASVMAERSPGIA